MPFIKVNIPLMSDFARSLKVASEKKPTEEHLYKIFKALNARFKSVFTSHSNASELALKRAKAFFKELELFDELIKSGYWNNFLKQDVIDMLLLNLEELHYELVDRLELIKELNEKSIKVKDFSTAFRAKIFKKRGRGFALNKAVLL